VESVWHSACRRPDALESEARSLATYLIEFGQAESQSCVQSNADNHVRLSPSTDGSTLGSAPPRRVRLIRDLRRSIVVPNRSHLIVGCDKTQVTIEVVGQPMHRILLARPD
jgi:hypothetical protein